jgi:hypothetical protein
MGFEVKNFAETSHLIVDPFPRELLNVRWGIYPSARACLLLIGSSSQTDVTMPLTLTQMQQNTHLLKSTASTERTYRMNAWSHGHFCTLVLAHLAHEVYHS